MGINLADPGVATEALARALIAALRLGDYTEQVASLNRVLGLNNAGETVQSQGGIYTKAEVDQIAAGLSVLKQLESPTVSLADTTFPLPDATDPAVQATRGSFFNRRAKPFLGRNRRTLIGGAAKTDFFDNGAAGFNKLTDTATTDAMLGQSTVRLSLGPAASSADLMPSGLFNGPINMSAGGQIRIWFRPVSNFDGLESFDLRLYSSGSLTAKPANYHRIQTDIDTDADVWISHATSLNGLGRWQSLGIPVKQLKAQGAGAALDAITFIELRLANASGQAVQLDLFRIEYVPPVLTKAKVCFTFDDGYELPYTLGLLNRFGFPVTFMPGAAAATIRSNLSTDTMRPRLLQNRNDFGDQVASQSWSSESEDIVGAMTDAQRTAFFAKIFAWQAALGLSGAQDGSYFTGLSPTHLASYPAIRQHFRSMRRVENGRISGSPLLLGEIFPFSDPMNYRALSITSHTGEDAGERYIAHAEQAVFNGGVAVFADHNGAETGSGPNVANIRAGYDELLEYLDDNRDYLDVCTIDDLHRQAEFVLPGATPPPYPGWSGGAPIPPEGFFSVVDDDGLTYALDDDGLTFAYGEL